MLNRITDRCYALPFERTGDRPALGYVRGDRISLYVDAGNSAAHAAKMAEAVRAEGLPPAGLAALTHSHWDHTYGLSALSCPTVACRRTQEQLLRMARWQWTLQAMAERLRTHEDILFCHEAILVEYPALDMIRVRPADIVFEDRLTLDLGGVHAELILAENSHANDCVIVHIPEEKVVFLGDICYTDLHHEPECLHRARFETLRTTLSALDFDWAVMGHQETLTRAELFKDMEETLSDPDLLILE